MQELTPQQKKKLLKLAEIADGKEFAITEELIRLDEKIDEILIENKGERGEKGEKGERGENGRDGIDGKDGKNGQDAVVDYDKILTDIIAQIPKQEKVEVDYDKILLDILSQIPEETGETIVTKINSSEKLIDKSKIEGLADIERIAKANAMPITTSLINGKRAKNIDFSGATVTYIGDNALVTVSSGGTPGGADTEVQFNDGGAFGGDSGFTYNKTTGTLTIDNISSSITNSLTLVGDDNVLITATGGQINLTGNGSVRFRSSLSGNFGQLDATALTTARNFAFQDGDGTLAFLSDLPSGTDKHILYFDGDDNPVGAAGLTYDSTLGFISTGLSALVDSLSNFGIQVTATGTLITTSSSDRYITLTDGSSGSSVLLGTDLLTFNRTIKFPDQSGTFALTSDLFTEQDVRDTPLTGLVITGTTIVDTDTVLEAFGKAQNQINGLIGGVFYQGTWNALTNTPTLSSGVGTQGHYYVVDTAGSTNLDGITDWNVGDWAIFNGTVWEKVDNTDAVVSVNGAIGAVSLTGTANRITVTGTVWDIAPTYVGQNSITTLGTITTGTWNGTAIANANLANSSLTIGSTNISLGATSTTLAGLTSVTSTSFTGALTGNASTATALQNARTIGIATGDVTSSGSSFNGTANNTNAYTLATVNANVGSFGSATQVGVFTVNGKGLITAASNTTITPAVGSITGLGTGVSTALAVNVGTAGAFVVNGGALGTPSSGTVTNLTGTASININGTVGATTPTTATFTTATVNTGLMPDVNDGAYLGQAGTAFSDLFLAEGGVINWDNGDMTLTQVGNMLTIAGGDLTTPNITVSAMTEGSMLFAGTGGLVSQDNAELFFNNSTNMFGIGTNDPQRKLHILSNSAATTTILALDNPNTTDGNGILQSFRTTTTGVGATAFTELGAIRTLVTTHDHATRASNFSFFNSIAGTLTESMKISETGDVSIGTTTALARLSVRQNTLGSSVQALSSVATNDDPTELVYQNRVATTNATVTTLHTFTIPASTTYTVTSWVVARRTGGTGGTAEDGAAYTISATFKNVAGTATQIGTTTIISTAENQAAWDCVYDVTGATARVRVTGATNNNVTWHLTARVWAVST